MFFTLNTKLYTIGVASERVEKFWANLKSEKGGIIYNIILASLFQKKSWGNYNYDIWLKKFYCLCTFWKTNSILMISGPRPHFRRRFKEHNLWPGSDTSQIQSSHSVFQRNWDQNLISKLLGILVAIQQSWFNWNDSLL